jgi:hypothetical protein
MKSNRTIKIKALFLVATFSLNTVVGFACSLGLDMSFNTSHHSHEEGEKHEHGNGHQHDGHRGHSQENSPGSHHHSDTDNNTASFSSPGEENCCTDFVVGFQNTDKQIAEKSSVPQKGISTLLYLVFAPPSVELLNAKGFAEHSRTPPREIDYSPPDVRVFIQSFLI